MAGSERAKQTGAVGDRLKEGLWILASFFYFLLWASNILRNPIFDRVDLKSNFCVSGKTLAMNSKNDKNKTLLPLFNFASLEMSA